MSLSRRCTTLFPILLMAGISLAAMPAWAAEPAKPASAPAKPAAAAPKPAAAAAKPAAAAAKPVAKATPKKAAAAPTKFNAANTLIWRGDLATGRNVVKDIAALYEKSAKVRIEQQPFSTISGLDAVASGKADIAGSARIKHDGRVEEANLNFIPQALDAIVPIVHPRNPITGLSLRQIRQIYLGRVTNWKEVGGLDAPINLYSVAAPMDGVEYTARWLLYRRGEQKIAAPRLYINVKSLEEGITLDPNGLGLSTLSAIYPRKDIKMLSVAGIAPSMLSVENGTYPLYVTLYLVNRFDDPKRAMVDAFVAFLGTPEAKASLRKAQLVPFADVADPAARDKTRLAFIDEELAREPVAVASTASPGVSGTPVAAPQATLAAKVAVAPTADSTQVAKDRAAAAAAAKAADAKQVQANKAATKASADKR